MEEQVIEPIMEKADFQPEIIIEEKVQRHVAERLAGTFIRQYVEKREVKRLFEAKQGVQVW